mgnify:CR=1 FL=1
MELAHLLGQWSAEQVETFCRTRSSQDVLRSLHKARLGPSDYLTLLSPAAQDHLEAMARRAQETTRRHFGRAVVLFTPLYLSNYCQNHCVYCGFNAAQPVARQRLDLADVAAEGAAIAASGLEHLLVLTGEAPQLAGVDYLEQCLGVLRQRFASVGLEVFPMRTEEYARLLRAGAESLTLYQETYDRDRYAELHPAGPKKDFDFRLGAPERACRAGMRGVNLGALLGLGSWRYDSFCTGMHAAFLQRRYPGVEIALSLPRMRPHCGGLEPTHPVFDAEFVQILLAHRLFLPFAGITLSTRESATLRDNVLELGVTKLSAGSVTAVGGHTGDAATEGQFAIADTRSVEALCAALRARRFQPVFKDWEPLGESVHGQAC